MQVFSNSGKGMFTKKILHQFVNVSNDNAVRKKVNLFLN